MFDNIQLIPAADGFDAISAQKDTCHLPNVRAATGLQWRDMLFFDDEVGNVTKVIWARGLWCKQPSLQCKLLRQHRASRKFLKAGQ